ncbi:MAG TPA: sensor histidine kinase [Nitrospira sp.]|nr:sensor histidine kinase [Nitrospira sp.]
MYNLFDLPFRAKPVERYSLAIGATLIAFVLRLVLDPGLGDDFPFIMFYCATAITAWYGGLGPSLTTIIGGGLLANWFFMPPRYSLLFEGPAQVARFTAYFLVSLLIVALGEVWRLDVTKRKRAEEALADLTKNLEERITERTQQLRSLATELNLAEQQERKRLAAELHDHLQHLLVLGKLKIGQGKRYAQLIPALNDVMKQVDEVLSEALRYTRTLVAELSPPVLRDYGLPTALKWLSDYMQKYSMTVSVTVPEHNELSLPEDQAVLLFQSVRELLMNSSKYAGTGKATVILEQRNDELRIQVRDEGAGFDVTAAAAAAEATISGASSKFGLFSIRERMKALGGSFEIHSVLGKGTTATLTLPLSADHAKTATPA